MHTRRRHGPAETPDEEHYDGGTVVIGNRYPSSSTSASSSSSRHHPQHTSSPSPSSSKPVAPPTSQLDEDMAAKDRTKEFSSIVKMISQRTPTQPNKLRPIQQRSQFMAIAKSIGKDLSMTYAKLEKLTLLAKKKSIFDDRPEEIQQLTYIIKQDIGQLNSKIAELQQLGKSQRSTHNAQNHSTTVVVTLQSKLANMSSTFKSVLETRTENLKEQKTRRDHFSNNSSVTSSQDHKGSVLMQDDSKEHTINMGESDRYTQQMQLIDQQDEYISSRANTMQNIETTIVELGGIFQQLAHMVKEQDEVVQRIDSNVEDTHLNVEAAHSEILKYFQSVSSNRWLMIKIFGVLLFFFVVFVVVMA